MAQLKYPVGYQGCYQCKIIKPLSEFYPSTPYTCKACKCKSVKTWNKLNADQHNSNKLKSIRRNQEYLFSFLELNSCYHCGTDDLLVLELHHLHGKQKRTHNVSSLVNSGASLERVRSEIVKCIVLCRNCHIIEECHLRYQAGRPDFRYAFQYHDEWPSYPRQQQIAKKIYLIEYFLEHPCQDCGLSNIVPLQFDHTLDNKEESIGWLLNNRGIDAMIVEIDKCDVVCANCHNHRTIQRAETWRLKYAEKEVQTV